MNVAHLCRSYTPYSIIFYIPVFASEIQRSTDSSTWRSYLDHHFHEYNEAENLGLYQFKGLYLLELGFLLGAGILRISLFLTFLIVSFWIQR